jgi:hypothetical protein
MASGLADPFEGNVIIAPPITKAVMKALKVRMLSSSHVQTSIS